MTTITNLADAIDALKDALDVGLLPEDIHLQDQPTEPFATYLTNGLALIQLERALEFLSEMKALYGNLSSEFIDADLHYASTPSDQEQS